MEWKWITVHHVVCQTTRPNTTWLFFPVGVYSEPSLQDTSTWFDRLNRKEFILLLTTSHPPRDLQLKCPWDRCLYGEQQTVDQNTRQKHEIRPPWMRGQHNVRGTARDNTGQNTHKGNTPSPRIEIKISDLARNRTRAAGLKGWKEIKLLFTLSHRSLYFPYSVSATLRPEN